MTNNTINITDEQIQFFHELGYVQVDNLIDAREVDNYLEIYDRFLRGEIDCGRQRTDLGNHKTAQSQTIENITQILRPSDYLPSLRDGVMHQRSLAIARQLQGDDLDFDFDMMIDKAPFTQTETPWHQDAAYWIDLSDKRAVSCWLALDEALVENGCMWFIPQVHHGEIFEHLPAAPNSLLKTMNVAPFGDAPLAVPLKPGCCTFHHGHTPHFTAGNRTDSHRRALITNFRPAAMIEYERAQGFNHGR